MASTAPGSKKKSRNKLSTAQKRKRRAKQAGRVKIAKQEYTRTLRKSARKKYKKEVAPWIYIMPWVHDPSYKYDPSRKHPDASFLGLPAELRQMILADTVDDFATNDWNREKIGKIIGKLSCISPLTRMDMEIVGKKWKDKVKKMEEEEKANNPQANTLAPTITQTVVRNKRGPVIVTKPKKKTKRGRDQKCWFCLRRHFSTDNICPPTRSDPWLWKSQSRDLAYKNPQGKGPQVFGQKTIFPD